MRNTLISRSILSKFQILRKNFSETTKELKERAALDPHLTTAPINAHKKMESKLRDENAPPEAILLAPPYKVFENAQPCANNA